jgi:hypothetical protein
MAQFFDDGQAVREFGAGVEVVKPELIKGEDAGDVGVLFPTAVSFIIARRGACRRRDVPRVPCP